MLSNKAGGLINMEHHSVAAAAQRMSKYYILYIYILQICICDEEMI